MGDEKTSVQTDLERALEHAENEEAEYWIRTALQRLVADRDGPGEAPP